MTDVPRISPPSGRDDGSGEASSEAIAAVLADRFDRMLARFEEVAEAMRAAADRVGEDARGREETLERDIGRGLGLLGRTIVDRLAALERQIESIRGAIGSPGAGGGTPARGGGPLARGGGPLARGGEEGLPGLETDLVEVRSRLDEVTELLDRRVGGIAQRFASLEATVEEVSAGTVRQIALLREAVRDLLGGDLVRAAEHPGITGREAGVADGEPARPGPEAAAPPASPPPGGSPGVRRERSAAGRHRDGSQSRGRSKARGRKVRRR